ncbi:two-component system response regulator DctR [Bacillus carboniphilus]|uniref:Two-component system response regulator DctR n=1 Tax=Bacillus carboniphilus TaxID=86663 RepID=A0ABP3FJ93_9BACI
MTRDIQIMLIEDDPMVQEVNRSFIERLSGFHVCAAASNGVAGLEQLKNVQPDLILLDNFMPEQNGIETLQAIRSQDFNVDVIVVTAAQDKETILAMKRYGAFDYIIKPFKFERLKQALLQYKAFKDELMGDKPIEQQDLDHVRGLIPSNPHANLNDDLPKGLNQQTLQQIIQLLSKEGSPLSAEETAERIGIARVTARRYLEYLQKSGQVKLVVEYGSIGRPINRYQWV